MFLIFSRNFRNFPQIRLKNPENSGKTPEKKTLLKNNIVFREGMRGRGDSDASERLQNPFPQLNWVERARISDFSGK